MESVIRQCFVMCPKEFERARNDGDDVFLCEYEYDIHWHSFKRISEIEDDAVVCFKIIFDDIYGTFCSYLMKYFRTNKLSSHMVG